MGVTGSANDAGADGGIAKNSGAAGVVGTGAGEQTVCPQMGQGPETPAMWLGTVSTDWQALHWNWITSGFMEVRET